MIVLLILLVLSKLNSIARADKDDDYINALPSEERYTLIAKFFRRVVQEVKAIDTPNATSFEIPDAVVAKSNEYVNKLVAEELAKIKTGRKNNKNRRPERNVTSPEDREDKYINFTFRTELHDDMKDHIDLTVAKKRKSMDPADVDSVKENPKIVRKREVSEVPVQVVFDKPKRSKRKERRSQDQDNVDRRDDKVQTITEKSRDKGIEFDGEKDDAKTLESASKELKDPELNKRDDDAETLESTEPKELLDREESAKSAELNKSEREREEDTEADNKTFKSTDATTPTETMDGTKTTEAELVTMITDVLPNATRPPSIDGTTLLVRFNDDTYHTTEDFLDATIVQPLTESTFESNTEEPITQESEKLEPDIIVSAAENLTSTVATAQAVGNTVPTTQTPENTVTTNQLPKITVPVNDEPKNTDAQPPKSTVSTTASYTQDQETTVPTVIEFKNPPVKKSLRIGVVSEEADGKNLLYRGDQLLRAGGKVTDAPLHFETLFDAEPQPTKKVRLHQAANERVVPSKTHQHGILYYRVFEVDPSLDPFKLRSEANRNQDQPHYAPVYNYEPESAFLSAQNIQGPNLRGEANDDEETYFGQTSPSSRSKDLRTNVGHESNIPVYNYESLNAYYNPQNRLGPNDDNAKEDLYYRQARIMRARELGTGNGKIDEDYYYARNEAIQDSVESRKFRFRGVLNAGDLGKSPLKTLSKAQDKLQNPFIYATAEEDQKPNRNQQNVDYIDYYYGRKDGRHEGKSGQKRMPLKKLSVDLDDYFSKNKKATLTRSRYSQRNPFYEFNSKDNTNRKQKKPVAGQSISLDYYYGVNEPLIYNLNHKAPRAKSKGRTEKTTRDGFPHRTTTGNTALDLDYYFGRKETNDDHNADEDFQDYDDRENADVDVTVARKSHRNKNVKNAKKNALKPYTRVLKDMFEMKSGVLRKYDWLGTTVNIRSALAKLLDKIDAEERGIVINVKDKEILKYLIAVHKAAANRTRADPNSPSGACFVASKFPRVVSDSLRYRPLALPKNKRRKPGYHIRNPLKLLRDVYMRLLRSCSDAEEEETTQDYKEFKLFLEDLEEGLYDFHTAIKSIASVTKYDRQNWHQNIQDLYLSRTKSQSKELLEVLTHLVVMEIFERIEQSARDGLEDDALKHRDDHPDEFEETRKELAFVLRLLREINKRDNI